MSRHDLIAVLIAALGASAPLATVRAQQPRSTNPPDNPRPDLRRPPVAAVSLSPDAVSPRQIYNTLDSAIAIRFQHPVSEKIQAALDGRPLAVTEKATTASLHITGTAIPKRVLSTEHGVPAGREEALTAPSYFTVIATVPEALSNELGVGTHTLSVSVSTGSVLEIPILIKGAINASVERIEPAGVMRYTENQIHVSIHGKNLKDIIGIKFKPFLPTLTLSEDGTVMTFEESILWSIDGPGKYDQNEIEFGDGSIVKLPAFTIYDRVAPWSVGSWVAFFVYHLIFLTACTMIYKALAGESHPVHLLNKTAPGLLSVLLLLLSITAASIICVLGAALFWSAFTNSFHAPEVSSGFLFATGFVGINVALPAIFVDLTGKFRPIAPAFVRWLIAAALIAIALSTPFLLTTSGMSLWLGRAETGLLLATILLGGSGMEVVRHRLAAERRQGPDDAVIDRIVEEALYSAGQVLSERDLPGIPRDRVKSALLRFMAAHDKLDVNLIDDRDNFRLRFERHQAVSQINTGFNACRQALGDQDPLSALAGIVQGSLGFDRGASYSRIPTPVGMNVASTRPLGLESVLPDPFPVITLALSAPIDQFQIRTVQEILNAIDTPTRFALTISVNHPTMDRAAIQANLGGIGRENVVVLGERELINIVVAKESASLALMRSVQEQVDLSVFSPYTVEGPTPIDMFYGRAVEIGTILERMPVGSVVVLGARRIGKTSTLQAAQRVLVERGRKLLYLDCFAIGDYETFLKEAAQRWRLPHSDGSRGATFYDIPGWIIDLQLEYPDQQIVIELDEIDRLLAYDAEGDRDEKFFRMLRSLAQERRCQFIFSGERTILDKLEDPSSSFFNFVTQVKLGLLDGETSGNIVLNPMRLVGVMLENDAAVEKIYDYTSGHPNLIQYVCRESLRVLGHQKRRVLGEEIVLGVLNSANFREQFLSTFWSQTTPLEKAISICVAEKQPITLPEIKDYFAAKGIRLAINDLKRSVKYLILCQLLDSTSDMYTIKPSHFSAALAQFPLSVWLDEFLGESKRLKVVAVD